MEKRSSSNPTPPAVNHRIGVLLANLARPNQWLLWIARFSQQFKQNLAELEALLQYGHSDVVWDIAYLNRKKVAQKLNPVEQQELSCLTVFHDSPFAKRITQLKLKEAADNLSRDEQKELTHLQRNLYRETGVPAQLIELLWPQTHHYPLEWHHLH
ncbi:hypothetical protein [Vampirovibrio sp.]|uniref:hypothetical protein n=1 Tax=Vampirovibrio sp. TaxID=2717857 RepID=UPI00359307BD